MRVLVTGGAGYVGSVTVERLVLAGHEVTVARHARHRPSRGRRPGRPARRRHSVADRRRARGGCSASDHIEAVLHCAARSLVGQSMTDPALYYHENVVGGIALLDALREAGVDRIVFSSTAAVYGEPERVPIRGDGPDPTRQPLRRVQARVRGRDALVRRRTACARCRCATSTWPARASATASTTTPRPTSSPTSCAPRASGAPG